MDLNLSHKLLRVKIMNPKTHDTINLMNGLIKIKYPSIRYFDFNFKLPLLGTHNFKDVSHYFFAFMFYFGAISSAYLLCKYSYKSMKWLWLYIRSRFNAKKYLQSSV